MLQPGGRMRASDLSKWEDAEAHCRQRLDADPSFDVPAYFFAQRLGWLQLIKTLRRLNGYSIAEAQSAAVRHRGWRRWCVMRMNDDSRCGKQAGAHVRMYGAKSMVVENGARWMVRADGCVGG